MLAVLATLFISLNLLAVAAVGYLSFRNGYKAVNSVAMQLRQEIGARIKDHLHTFARTPFIITQSNANLMSQGLLPPDDPLTLERHFWHQVQEFESVSSIYFGNPQGGLADAGREGAGGFLYVIATDNFTRGPFKKYLTDNQGRRTELLLEVPNFDARTRGWYTHALEAGGPVWNAPYILFSGQDMAIAASQPVYSPDGALLGVVSVDIFLSQLSDFLQSLEIGKTGQAFIVERKSGLLVATSTETPLFTASAGETPRERIPALESESTLIRRVTETLLAQAGSLETVTTERQFAVVIDGATYFAQVTPFQDRRGLDWLVVVVIPEADFMAQIQANTRQTLLLMVGTLLLTATLTVLLTYRILGPVKSLAGFSRAIQQGEWGKTISHDSRIAEISLMTQAFNQMSRQMAATIAELNREIAAHQASTQALSESEHRLRSIVEQLNDGVSITDEQGRLIVWNRRLEEFTGLPAETMLGKYLWDVQFELLPPAEQTPERRARLEKDLRGFLETGQAPWAGKLLERKFIRPDGRTLYLEGTAFPIQTASGYLLGSITRDITERKRIELERDTARQLFQKMFELSPVAIALSSVAERRIVDVNTATERLLGYSRAELIGQHSPAIDYWADPEERQHAFETLLAEGRIAGYEFTFKTKSGRTGRALIFAELFEQQGEQYILSAFVDITELQSYREHLEELVAERTARLQQSLEDLRRFALLAADRELRIKELREENKRLREQLKAAGRDIL